MNLTAKPKEAKGERFFRMFHLVSDGFDVPKECSWEGSYRYGVHGIVRMPSRHPPNGGRLERWRAEATISGSEMKPLTRPPTGTVAFLFSDIEGSTVRWDTHRVDMQEAVGRHDELDARGDRPQPGGYVFRD